MKKLLISLAVCIGVVFVGKAETGTMAVGGNIGAAPCLESGANFTNFGLTAKFQYGLSDKVRLEADMEYWFKDKGVSVFDITANAHYLFAIGEKVTVYPLAGFGFAHVGTPSHETVILLPDGTTIKNVDKQSDDKFLLNIGAGAEYALTDRLSVGFELKYQYINHFSRFPIQLGVAYKF